MKYFLKNLEVCLTPTSILVENVEWYLGSSIVNVGYEGEEFSEIEKKSFGSNDGVFGEQDVYRFLIETKRLFLFRLKCSSKIEVREEGIKNIENSLVSLEAISPFDFGIESCSDMVYFSESDSMLARYEEFELSNPDIEIVTFTKNVHLIFLAGSIAGWLLTRTMSLIVSPDDETRNSTPTSDDKLLLVRYFWFCNDEIFDLMDDEDESIRLKLIELKEDCERVNSNVSKAIIEAIDGIIIGYY